METNETAALLCGLFDHVFEIVQKQHSVCCLRSDRIQTSEKGISTFFRSLFVSIRELFARLFNIF